MRASCRTTSGVVTSFQNVTAVLVGPCLQGYHCFALTHPLQHTCPGCTNFVHVNCGSYLDYVEGCEVNGKMKCFPKGSVVCFACDPETNAIDHTVTGSSSSSDGKEEDDVVNEGQPGDTTFPTPLGEGGFPTGPCVLGSKSLAPTHELQKHCPGCGELIHVLCGCVLEE